MRFRSKEYSIAYNRNNRFNVTNKMCLKCGKLGVRGLAFDHCWLCEDKIKKIEHNQFNKRKKNRKDN